MYPVGRQKPQLFSFYSKSVGVPAHLQPSPASLQIQDDKLTKIARKNWSPEVQQGGPKVELPAFDPKIVTDIYRLELGGGGQKSAKLKRIMLLEISQYLENYLWPHFDAGEPQQLCWACCLGACASPGRVFVVPFCLP